MESDVLESTTVVPDFTQFETDRTVLDESAIEVPRASENPNPAAANSTTSTTANVTSRTHSLPTLFPFLTMVRYLSTAYVSDVVTEEFATPSIRHSCVSEKYESYNITILVFKIIF